MAYAICVTLPLVRSLLAAACAFRPPHWHTTLQFRSAVNISEYTYDLLGRFFCVKAKVRF